MSENEIIWKLVKHFSAARTEIWNQKEWTEEEFPEMNYAIMEKFLQNAAQDFMKICETTNNKQGIRNIQFDEELTCYICHKSTHNAVDSVGIYPNGGIIPCCPECIPKLFEKYGW